MFIIEHKFFCLRVAALWDAFSLQGSKYNSAEVVPAKIMLQFYVRKQCYGPFFRCMVVLLCFSAIFSLLASALVVAFALPAASALAKC